jgi:hypothetical protein
VLDVLDVLDVLEVDREVSDLSPPLSSPGSGTRVVVATPPLLEPDDPEPSRWPPLSSAPSGVEEVVDPTDELSSLVDEVLLVGLELVLEVLDVLDELELEVESGPSSKAAIRANAGA